MPPTALPPQFGGPAAGRVLAAGGRAPHVRGALRPRRARANRRARGRAAAELGVTRQGLTKLMSRLGIAAELTAAADG